MGLKRRLTKKTPRSETTEGTLLGDIMILIGAALFFYFFVIPYGIPAIRSGLRV